MSGTRSWARRRVAVALAATVALGAATFGTASTAHATPESELAAERDKATQLEAQIEANGTRVSILDEQYTHAQLAIQQANQRLAAAQRQLEARQRETDAVRAELATRSAELYMNAGNPAPLAALDVEDANELGSRSAYASAAADADRRLLDEAKVAIEQLGIQQQSLERARAEAQQQSEALESARREIEQATADQQDLLAQAQGRIASLVDEVRAEREAAAEAAARAEMERQAAEALAARPTPDPPSDDNGASGGTDPTAGSPGDVPAPNPQAEVAVDTARAQLGKPYVYAGSGPDVFDCSGLTMYAWAAAGVSLPHNAEAQYMSLPHVSQSELQPGDLLFFGAPIHHVGMYVGGGTMIEAPYTGVDVRYRSIYRSDFAGAARP